ncbi:ThiF family adenylyltransferase [Treponema phagedenis]|uniref:ThiF family adenylyltransferase n=1 Tax=Treponema phagedenis TaxID=162 RepID=UPI001652E52C|nr:ThiF family adenylyltransferase [Treponema phagedenis]
MLYKKSPLAIIFPYGVDNYVVGYGSRQDVVSVDKFISISKLLFFLETEKDDNDLDEFLKKNCIDKSVFDYCCDKKLITSNNFLFEKRDTVDYKNRLYLEATFPDAEKLNKNIQNTTFIIVGCGGIGNWISYSLASYIPQELVLVDADVIDVTNLNRQFMFSVDDIGCYKIDILERELKKRFTNISVSKHYMYANAENLEKIYSDVESRAGNIIVIVSGDSEFVVQDVIRISAKFKYPTLNVGYLNDYSIIGPFFIPGKSACPFCKNILADAVDQKNTEVRRINSTYRSPSSFVNNAFSSSMATVEILKYLDGDMNSLQSLNKRIGLSNMDFSILKLDLKRNVNCEYCGQNIKA